MASRLIFKNGQLITAERTIRSDVLVEGEKISAVGIELEQNGAEIIDCTGRFILPGGVDPHTHFDLPMFDTVSSDDHYTGHKAAAFGGTTTVMDFVPQEEGGLLKSFEVWQEKAAKAAIDYGFHMNITSLTPAVEAELPALLELGIPTLKVFMAYNGRLRLQDRDIFKVMRIAKSLGMLVMLHAENGDVIEVLTEDAIAAKNMDASWHAKTRPAWSAVDAVLRGCALAAQAEAPLYVVHMNTRGGVDMVSYARERGVHVMGETCPQYLYFTSEALERRDGAKWVCSPPIRHKNDQERLWRGLKDGSLQVIGTDHCAFYYDGTKAIDYEGELIKIPGKELGKNDFTKIPNGLPAVGDRLPVLWSYGVRAGRITQEEFVALTSTNPAKIFGLYPQKGSLLPGADADLVVWDPDKSVKYGVEMAQHRTDYNLFQDWNLTGFPEKVFLRGECIVDHGQWFGKRGKGNYLPRKFYQFI